MAGSLAERARPCQRGRDKRVARPVAASIPTSVPEAFPPRETPIVARVRARVASALREHPHVVLAVSGGRDSAVLLDAALAVAPERVRLVATFDHGTGASARRAVRHVCALARGAGVPVRVGHGDPGDTTEAAWRAARWQFLRRAARTARGDDGAQATIATGHTADDQLETVVMRLLRDAGARGLAAMYAPAAGVVRPLLATSAADVAAYAAARGLTWVADPSNASRRHLRNRVRHELLPALLAVSPALGVELLGLARATAASRRALDAVAARLARRCPMAPGGWADDGHSVAALADLEAYDASTLTALWPAMVARVGVRLDRRGTARLTTFTMVGLAALASGRAPSGSATVAGGVRLVVERRGPAGSPEWVMVVRCERGDHAGHAADGVVLDRAALARGVRLGAWRFRMIRRAPTAAELEDGRVAWLEADRPYTARAWQPGDRWRASSAAAARRVKRFLAERHVPLGVRAGWPVVLAAGPEIGVPRADGAAGGEIVWVPGVRRSCAAPVRPGQPGFYLLCERTSERRPGTRRLS